MSVKDLKDAQDLQSPVEEVTSVVDTDNVQTETAVDTANEKGTQQEKKGVTQTEKKEKPVVITGKQLLQMKVTEMRFLMDPFLQPEGIAILGGSSDAGKSTWGRQLGIAIVRKEKEVFGFKLNSVHHSVIYVSYEDDLNAVAHFLNLQNITKAKEEEFEGLRFMFQTGKLLKKLDAELTRKKADLVIIDTLSDVFDGTDFHSSPAVKRYFKRFKKITRKHKCLILFIHHLGKNKEFLVPNKNSLLGSQGVEANARCVLEFRKDRFDTDLRHLILLKGNYHKDALKNYSHVLKFNDKNMLFTNTGMTRPIEELAGDRKINEKEEMIARAIELHGEGISWIKVAKQISEEFETKISKTTINDWVLNQEKDKKKFCSKGKDDNEQEKG